MTRYVQLLFAVLILMSCNSEPKKNSAIIKDVTIDTIKTPNPTNDTIVLLENMNLASSNIPLSPHVVQLQSGDSFYLNIPTGFQVKIAAETGTRLRFLTKSPDNRLFATDMHNRSDNKKGKVLLFEEWNDSTKTFGKQTIYLDGLHNPNQIAFYGGFLYVAETDRLRRFAYKAADAHAADTGQTIAIFPDYGLNYKYGGWHLTRSITFHKDKLYVSVGSSCNACVEKEAVRAVILEMSPDGTNQTIFARGLRNSVGIKWIGDQLWSTGMGRDLIGPDKPEDVFQQVEAGGYYGWPFYFQYQQKIYADKQFKDSTRPAYVKEPPIALVGFKAHSAPLGFDYFKGFEKAALKDAVLVCLHGSTSVWRQRGNSIVKLEKGSKYTEVVSGFLTGKTDTDRHGRPCDILMNDSSSFYFTDDLHGVLYYVWKDVSAAKQGDKNQ